MKNVLLTCLSLALSLIAQAQADTWSVKFSNAIISRYQPTISAMQPTKGWEYSNGIILHGIEKVYLQTGTASYLNYIKAYVDTYVGTNGTIPTSNLSTTVDKIQPGVLCLFLYEQTGDIRYKTAATQLRNYLLTSGGFSKTPDGGYWHKNDGNYNNVMMVDGMYMLHPFLTKYGAMFNDTTCTGVATFQLLLLASHVMYSPRTLPKHAWDYTKTKTWASTTTGESTDVWSRGTGWYMMALADVLQYLPTSHYRYARIMDLFQRMAAGVAANQHPTTGLWYQVVDKRTVTGNWTESSGSGMFVYALKKGVDNGWLSSSTYTPVINKGWTGLQTQIATLADGPQIRQFCVASGVVNNTAAYYSLGKTNCPTGYPWSGTQHPHGYCGILMAASQMEFNTVAVTGIILSPTSATLSVGSTQQLTAAVTPSDATNKTVNWTSGNTSVATVSSTGLVTAVAAGTAVITAQTADGGFTATCNVTASVVNVTGVSVSPSSVSINVGSTTNFTATVTPSNASNQTVMWISDNNAIATVSSSGVVTGVSAGTAGITATTTDGGFTAIISQVTVSNVAVSGVSVNPTSLTIGKGANSTLTATVSPSNATNKTVSWSSSNTAVATVSSAGVVTGVAAGSAVVTVTTADGGFTANSAITVSASCSATGYITFQKWLNITGTNVSSLTSNANYPNNPSSSSTLTSFEIPSNSANNYGSRVSGYICPPATGNYTFWISGDDNVQLWLSTNNLEANKVRIAYHTSYTNPRQWTKFTTQKSAVKYLVQGNTYYVEALQKDGTGNDNMAVGWLKPGQTGTVPSEIIPGSVLSPRSPLKMASVQSTVRNPENLNQGSFEVYPNPARGEVTLAISENLSGKKMVFAVLDMSGQVVMKKEKTVGLTETIDLHNLVSGLYMIRVNCEGFSANKIISVIQ